MGFRSLFGAVSGSSSSPVNIAQVETARRKSARPSLATSQQLELNGRISLSSSRYSRRRQSDWFRRRAGRRLRNVAYSVNGGRTEYNNWELDGGDNMDNGSNSTLNVTQYRGYCRIQSPHL